MDDLERDFCRFRDRGDAAALGRVYDATVGELYGLALRLVGGDPAEAEDAVQATYLAAIESSRTFDAGSPTDGPRRLMPWLVGILNHRLQSRRSERARHARLTTGEIPARPASLTDLPPELREFDACVATALDAVDEPYRTVLVLRLRHGLEPTEIAYALSRRPASVRSQLARGLDKLRHALPRGFAASGAAAVFGLGTAARGMDGVRAVVMEGARAFAAGSVAAPAAAGAVTAAVVAREALPWTLSGLLMSQTTKVGAAVAAVVVLCLGAGALWFDWGGQGEGPIDPVRLTGGVDAGATDPGPATASGAGPAASGGVAEADARVALSRREPGGALVVEVRCEGQPLAGVSVRCEVATAGPVHRGVLQNGRAIAGATVVAAQRLAFAATGSTGDATFVFAAESVAGRVWVSGCSAFVDFKLAAGESRTVTLDVPTPGWVRGVVRHGSGAAAAGAVVWTSPQAGGRRAQEVAVTGAEGRFEIPQWVRSRIGARHPEGSDVHQLVDVEPGAVTEVVLVLGDAPATLAGVVVDAASKAPVAGATVRVGEFSAVYHGHRRLDGSLESVWPVQTTTDAEGRFECFGLAAGGARIRVDGPHHAVTELVEHLARGSRSELRVELDRGVTLFGVVSDAEGDPVVGARVGLRFEEWPDARTAVTGDDGRYELGHLPRDPLVAVEARVRRAGRAHAELDLSRAAEGGGLDRVEWSPVLDPRAAHIDGQVRDEAGLPLAGWCVTSHRASGRKQRSAVGWTDDAGNFSIGPSPEDDGWWELRVHPAPTDDDAKRSGWPETAPVLITDPVQTGTHGLELVVPRDALPSATLRGRLVTTAQRPGRGLFLRAETLQLTKVELAADGAFATDLLVPGRWELVRTTTYPAQVLGTWTLAAGEARDIGSVEVPSETFGVVVVDIELPEADYSTGFDGRAALGVYRAADDTFMRWFSLRAAQPKLSLLPGEYRLRLVAAPVEPLVREVEVRAAEEQTLVLRPRPATLQRFDLRCPARMLGRPPSAVRLEIFAGGAGVGAPVWVQEQEQRGAEGWFFQANLTAGRYHVVATSQGEPRWTATHDLVVEPGRSRVRPVPLTLRRGP